MDLEHVKKLHQKARGLPMEPGCYLMKNKAGEIIYVGKAKLLKNRVSSYFRAVEKHTPKVYGMVENVEDFDFIVVNSEFEALVLECSLIKQHQPKYNILLKDDKGYCYVKIDAGEYPRIRESKTRDKDGATYIGPYLSSWVVKQTVDEANKTFLLPTCNRSFPRDFRKGRPCLNFHMKQCMGVCRGNIGREEYREALCQAVEFIQGGGEDAVAVITKKMSEAAENLEFERAARYRDRLRAIERSAQKQYLVFQNIVDQDVVAFVQGAADVSATVMKYRGKKLVDKADFMLKATGDLVETRGEFLSRYYMDQADGVPGQLTVDGEVADRELIERMLSEKSGRKVKIFLPRRGELATLIETAKRNAAEQLTDRTSRTGKEIAALDELAKILGLKNPPSYIESYDVSNIGTDTVVGAMAVFEDGRPLRSAYKKFSMKTVVGTTDDYASMAEMLERRFRRYLLQEADGGGFNRLPDLLLIDGGKGHVSAVRAVLSRLGLEIPTFGMVKDSHHRTRAIAAEGAELSISANRSAFTLVSSIQEETHRFAITYSRQKHKKSAFELSMTRVDEIGPARAREIFKCFKTQKAMKEASLEELAAVKGMNRRAAQSLYAYLHEAEE